MSTQAATPEGPADDGRPVVGRPVSNRAVWIFGIAAVLAAVLLFNMLEARRADIVSPATTPTRQSTGGLIASPPSLSLPGGTPGEYDPFGANPLDRAPQVPAIGPQFYPEPPRAPRQQAYPEPPRVIRAPVYNVDPDSPNYRPPGMQIDPRPAPAPSGPPEVAPVSGDRLSGGRVGATRLANPSVTVPQGTVIQAVLETALDSNRPGFARAVVSRDVRSFDGSRVLIPRGSRLFGEYKADLASGQNRAFVNWQKLTRPDGVQIAVESPAADPLGRAGVKGSVDTHFFERFGGAILQSTLDVGVGLATRSVSDNAVVIGLPGSTQTLIRPDSQSIRPTLKVKQGSSVSVFVARDLDFSTVQ